MQPINPAQLARYRCRCGSAEWKDLNLVAISFDRLNPANIVTAKVLRFLCSICGEELVFDASWPEKARASLVPRLKLENNGHSAE